MNQSLNPTGSSLNGPRERCLQRTKLRIKDARVLVVDDDEDLRKLHAAILDFEGYKVSVAANGADALEQLAEAHFDLLLTDRQMPVMGGEALVIALRSAGLDLPVVMLSGSLPHHGLPQRVAREIAIALPKATSAATMLAAVYLTLSRSVPALAIAA